jgi:tetratricopeptide (TPR) repeat protein
MRLLNFKNYNKTALGFLLAAPIIVMADKADDIKKQINTDINQVIAIEQQKEEKARSHVRAAKEFFVQDKYKQAVDQYLAAIKVFGTVGVGNSSPFKDEIAYCKEQIYQCYYYWAMDIVSKVEKKSYGKDYAKAIELCQQAAEMYPPCKEKMDAKIKKLTVLRDAATRRYDGSETKLIPTKKEQSYDIQVLLKQADELIKAERYTLAKEKYEQILLNDLYNFKAIEGLRAVNKQIAKMSTRRLYAQDKERIAEVVWKSATPIVSEIKETKREVMGDSKRKFEPVNKIREKLKSIVIPRLDFEDITVETAVRHLREQSKQLDPEGVGVNIFLRLKAPEVKDSALEAAKETMPADMGMAPPMEGADPMGAPPVEQPPADDFAEAAPGQNKAEDVVNEDIGKSVVDLVLVNRNLYQAIYFLCKAANLKFRIEKYAVVIAAKNVPLDDLETKIFPVEQGALAAVGGDDASSLEDYFKDRGIKFPSGAKIVYDSRISRLIATNTLDNLSRIESIIQNELSSKDPMVQIQAKFIEIEQNDLKELGFNWTVSNQPSSDNGTFDIDDSKSNLGSVGDVTPTIFRYQRVVNGFNLDFDVNALNQVDSKNLLSSPRITTMNGREASIRLIREVYYPDDYTEAETTTTSGSEGGTGTYSFISSIPEFADPTELGIILRVTPDVDVDHRTITMRVNPTVQSFVRWSEYNYDVIKGNVSTPVSVRQPVIAARTIDTKITIYDGETIVLGGILKDTTVTINERVPILGDIPLVGRLFQSIGTESAKINLLIFLTCRLVKPDGTAFFPDVRPNGLPPFDRLR